MLDTWNRRRHGPTPHPQQIPMENAMKTRLASITRTLLLGTLALASASALATQPAPQ